MALNSDIYDINKTLSGDISAFTPLVLRYKDFVYTIVIRMINNKQDAEEITQDVFIKAFEQLGSYQGNGKFSTWLYTIAYRKALDKLRSNKNIISVENIDTLQPNDISSIKNELDNLLKKERKMLIKNCINKLDSVTSTIFTLYYYDEQSIKEISTITNLTVDNIKIKLFRGRKKLYLLLQSHLVTETI